MSQPSVLFMGSKPGSVVALEYLLRKSWDVLGVVVSGSVDYSWYGDKDLRFFANKAGIPVYVQSEIPDALDVDYVISYMYRHLVKDRVRGMAAYASINFHAAPLPEFGGWGTYNLAILRGSDYFGCTCHHMADGFDDGDLVAVRRFPIQSDRLTAFDLENLAQEEMVRLFVDVVGLIESDRNLPRFQQDRAVSNYMSFDQMESLKRIPAGADDILIQKMARAFWFPPHKGAYFAVDGMELEVVPNLVKETFASQYGLSRYDGLSRVLCDYAESGSP